METIKKYWAQFIAFMSKEWQGVQLWYWFGALLGLIIGVLSLLFTSSKPRVVKAKKRS
ncbi:hypothetical protein C7447_102251 [Tenacibaculum adriaticum]|uniref:Uncharacterized protein n=1 Tax=Tenacibaculum adriaticum TaxID=413713 RepID=A0A5S5DSN1_9FLAO|nr:hypothetical protein [Tenacibaculum adriaticum]TYP98933.1 hypothetical protein C7447_102251 [Tenacibaculum adriaticum]